MLNNSLCSVCVAGRVLLGEAGDAAVLDVLPVHDGSDPLLLCTLADLCVG